MGPYRTPAEPPERFERFWQMLERRRRVRRAFWPLMVVSAFGVFVLVAMLQFPASKDQPRTVEEAYVGEPWGFVIAATHTQAWTQLHPKNGQPPSSLQSPFSAARLQRALASGAEGIRRCYVEAIPGEHTAWGNGELSGDLVATIHVHDGHRVTVVSGAQPMRSALSSCIERELESVKLPSPVPCVWTPSPTPVEERECDVMWFNFPLRFQRS